MKPQLPCGHAAVSRSGAQYHSNQLAALQAGLRQVCRHCRRNRRRAAAAEHAHAQRQYALARLALQNAIEQPSAD